MQDMIMAAGTGTGAGWVVTFMVWVAGLCSWAATLMSAAAVWSHCKHYCQPNLQRWVVRIIMMVPVYALTAWASLVWVESAYYLDTVRDVYEAFVIYCFVSLLIAYFGGERAFLVAMHDQAATPLFWPASLVRKDLDLSDPYDYLFLKRGILQYVAVKPLLAASTMALKSLDAYHEGEWSVSDGYVWTQVVYNCSVSLSLYCLVVFYVATRSSLAQWNPLPKFLCVKAIVFFSYWQGLGISILVGLGLIHDTSTVSAEHVAAFLQSWLICLEMIGGAFGHWVSFSHLDYVPASRLAGRLRLVYAVRDAAGLKDVVVDAVNAWSGRRYTYRHFEPAAPVSSRDWQVLQPARRAQGDGDTLRSVQSSDSAGSVSDEAEQLAAAAAGAGSSSSSVIKERRLRAGMRYTQGGKKTYWLPVEPVDHRAVALGSGSGGTRAAAHFVASSLHASSKAVRESRRVQRHVAHDATPDERSRLIAGAAAQRAADSLAEISMDLGGDECAADDLLYAEARGVEGDFNYPVMEVGVAAGFGRRRPYGDSWPAGRHV